MKRLLFFCLLGAVSSHAAEAKTLKQRVDEFTAKYRSGPEIQKRHLEWIKQEPDNPDAYILPANACLSVSGGVSINAGDQKGAFADLVNPKTGKRAGTIAPRAPDPALITQGRSMLTAAAKKFPQRLDIHVGRMAMAQRGKEIGEVRASAFDLLDAVAKNPQAMRWIDGAVIEGDPTKKATDEIHSRIRWLYGLENDVSDKAAHDCAVKALKLSPDDVELINDAAIYHLYRGEWKEGRVYLLRAEKAAPRDWIVQHNIARASAELGDKADALKRLQAIIKAAPGTNEARSAEESIQSLDLLPKKK